MVCIYCHGETEVTNSRERARTPSVWRRRGCKSCVAQFTTIELPDYSTALAVKSGDEAKLYPFSRDKLFLSLLKSLGHRDSALNNATALTETVIGRLLNKSKSLRGQAAQTRKDGVVSVGTLAKTAYGVLKRFDSMAAHTYKAYHQAALRG